MLIVCDLCWVVWFNSIGVDCHCVVLLLDLNCVCWRLTRDLWYCIVWCFRLWLLDF